MPAPAQRASSWSSSRRPTPARRASVCSRSSSASGASSAASTSTSPCRPSGSTRAAPTTRCAHAEGRRRPHGGLHGARGRGLRAGDRHASCRVSSPEAAELTKLLENIFRSVNIALMNEMAMLCDRMGIDVWEVADAAATKPFGFMSFKPGPGPRRPLPAARPVLPVLEGARVRLLHRVHRARRQGQREHAVRLLRAEACRGAERPSRKSVRGRAGARARRRLQGRHRRHPRVAGAEADRAPCRADGANVDLPRPARGRPAAVSASDRCRSTTTLWRRPTASVIVTGHSTRRLRRASSSGSRSWSTSATPPGQHRLRRARSCKL